MNNTNKTDPLFELIQTLSRSEKRYFRLYGSVQQNSPNYMRLFEALEKQKQYDENALREQFQGEPFTRQLHVLKNYLQEMLLKSLRSYHANHSIRSQIESLIFDATILRAKGQSKLSKDRLKKARELAVQHEQHLLLLEITEYENTWFVPPPQTQVEALEEQKELLRCIENRFDYNALNARMNSSLLKQGKPRTQDEEEAIEEIAAHPLMQSPANALSLDALNTYFFLWSSYHFARKELEQAREATQQRLKIFEENPEKIIASPQAYIAVLTNLLVLCKNDDRAFNDLLNRMRGVPKIIGKRDFGGNYVQYLALKLSSSFELARWAERGEFAKVAEAMPSVLQKLHSYGALFLPTDRLRLSFTYGTALLGTERYHAALLEVQSILDEHRTMQHQVVQTARIITLILFYELKEFDLLGYRIASIRRLWHRRKKLFQFEAIVLRYLQKLPDFQNPKEVRQWFSELYLKLSPLQQNPHERAAFDYFDYLSWLRSKVDGVSFAEGIARERQSREL